MFASTFVAYGVRFVMGIVLARFLGSEQLGLYSLALTAASIASGLALLGLPAALVRYVSLFASRRDEEGLWSTLQVGIGLPLALSALVGIGLFVGADLIAESLLHEARLAAPLRLISLAIPFETVLAILVYATHGFKTMQYSAIGKDIAQPVVKLSVVAVLAVVGLNATKALAAHILSLVTAFIILVYFLNRLFSLRRPLRASRRHAGEIIRFSLPLYVSYLLNTFRLNIQTVLLGVLHTVATVGVFTVVSQVNLIGKIFQNSIGTTSAPIVSELYSRGDREQLARFYQTMTKWSFTLNLPLFLVLLMFPGPILSIFGEDYVGGALALTILAWANLIDAGTGICGEVLNMSGKTSWSLVNTIVLSILVIGLNAWLIPLWGLIGAAVAAMISIALVNLMRLLEVLFLLRLLPYNVSFLKPVVAGLAAVAASWIIRTLFHMEVDLVYAAVATAILLAVYLAALLLLGLSQEDRMVLARIGRRVDDMLGRRSLTTGV